ncbi:serine/threonine-protein kinase [Leptotrichia sp. oral taxon 221]|uniref:serine/threonine-protein kinase n=1 Tax=Leptotrichia sp. oral taxon 221 TaxID=712362 RepID=UPI001B8B7CEC|nr:serine/threonine-protein kinase [Leptotrichia sp. oral taxon 221]QUB97891.1 serine/threonine protein kinase [Leptotrichia sp. oral taxon 221]
MDFLPLDYKFQNNYEIEGYIDETEFSNVYLVSTFNKKYVIKECFPKSITIRDDDLKIFTNKNIEKFNLVKNSFQREKEILEKLDKNKDVVNLVNFFEENNTIYLVLEYFEGINLKKYVLENELPEKEILQIFLEIVKIVIEIHDECVIHRDIKPSNILINGKNEIKIIDFGTGLLKGNRNGDYIKVTEGYSALEMYSLKTEIDERSDMYSLCALLYFMLEKKKLKSVLDRFYSEELTFERKINEDLKKIMEKGLAIHRKERYRSCLEIYYEILRYIEKFEN